MAPRWISLLLALVAARAGATEQLLLQRSWTDWQAPGGPQAGALIPAPDGSGEPWLAVEQSADGAMVFTVLRLACPPIIRPVYALSGRVACTNVDGQGYLELLNYFPGGAVYFTRTLGARGPMAALRGSSPPRWFTLPFQCTAGHPAPTQLELRVVLPGRGKVTLSPPRLAQYDRVEAALREPGSWWDTRGAGVVGGVGGALAGVLGGLAGMLAGRGKARCAALTLNRVMALIGVLLYLAFRYGEHFLRLIGEAGTAVFLRLTAFILLCLGVQIVWDGVSELLLEVMSVPTHLV